MGSIPSAGNPSATRFYEGKLLDNRNNPISHRRARKRTDSPNIRQPVVNGISLCFRHRHLAERLVRNGFRLACSCLLKATHLLLRGGTVLPYRISTVSPFRRSASGGNYDWALRLRLGFAGQKFFRRSHDAVIPICDKAANLIETRERGGDFKERCAVCSGQVTHTIKIAFSACSRRGLVAKTVATK